MAHPRKKTKVARNAALLFGKAVREARIAAKLTLEEAAKKADLRIDFLRNTIESNLTEPFASRWMLAILRPCWNNGPVAAGNPA